MQLFPLISKAPEAIISVLISTITKKQKTQTSDEVEKVVENGQTEQGRFLSSQKQIINNSCR